MINRSRVVPEIVDKQISGEQRDCIVVYSEPNE